MSEDVQYPGDIKVLVVITVELCIEMMVELVDTSERGAGNNHLGQ